MTELQKLYVKFRIEGAKHRAAIRQISAETGIDEATVSRCLARAKREDDRSKKKAKA
jgi:hypothetical protein